jgi:hypothetical protein
MRCSRRPLAIALAVGAATEGLTFPHPVGRIPTLAVAGVLFVAAIALWRRWIGLAPLAVVNVTTAVGIVLWLAAASGFSTGGAALLGATVAGLVGLAAAELALARAPD